MYLIKFDQVCRPVNLAQPSTEVIAIAFPSFLFVILVVNYWALRVCGEKVERNKVEFW